MDSFTLNKIEFDAVRHILAGFCRSSLGRNLALRITPSRNPQIIRQWLEQVTQMARVVREAGLAPFGGITDISAAMERAQPGGGATGQDFAAIASTLEGAGNVKTFLSVLPEELGLLRELIPALGDFAAEVAAIRAIVEPDGSIGDSASEHLAAIRREMAQTTQKVHDLIYGYLHQPEVAKLLQNVAVTLHGDRYVLPVKVENRGRLPGVVHRASNTGATVFIEPNACVELNNRLVDLYDDERREIARLLSELALKVTAKREPITAALRMLSQIDLLVAKAQYACQFDMTCPDITERGALVFTQARHPLLIERNVRLQAAAEHADKGEASAAPAANQDKVVPIDVRLGQDFDVMVITGSNTGGKTVTLKTVALLAIMAQSGMHIPVQRGAVMPAFRDVLIDVGDEQSLQQSLSTFGAHIKRIRYMLNKADQASLVLLDELGSGTDPDEGGAIGQATLDELRHIGCLAMVTTHLSVLKAYAFTHERVDNASVEFDTQTLRPTYHLRIGTPGESHAITVAGHLGLPKRIVQAARQYLSSQGKQFRRAIQATTLVRQDAEKARAAATQAQLEAQTRQEVYQSKLADLHRLQDEFNLWLARLTELKAGDEVFVPSLGRNGRLVRLELHRQIALVSADSLDIEVPLRDLMPDLGQEAVREQIDSLRKQILSQAAQAETAMAEARRVQEQYQHSLSQQRERARQLDMWLAAIARVKVGDEVPIAIRPGRGTLVSLDFTGLKAKVQTADGEKDISLQDIFPQTGPFAHYARREPLQREYAPRPTGEQPSDGQRGRPPAGRPARPFSGRRNVGPGQRQGTPQAGVQQAPAEEPPQPNRPMVRRSPDDQAAKANREKLLAVQPGQQVYVVPFHKRATLIRLNADKDQAVVQSGIFELEIPLADLEPIKD